MQNVKLNHLYIQNSKDQLVYFPNTLQVNKTCKLNWNPGISLHIQTRHMLHFLIYVPN